ncbi:MAG: hypothetical protein ACR2QC_07095 [Gammaproteobacteria bacterium]
MNADNFPNLRRGALMSKFADDAQWTECDGCEVAESFAAESVSPPAGVCDLSPLPRVGAKGECAAAAPPPNTFAAMPDGALCCRLGADEILILASPSGGRAEIDKTIMPSPRVHIPRRDSHCQIGLCGAEAENVLARLCAVPPPRKNELLQTRVADISAIVVSESRAAGGAFYLLADAGYAVHLWEEVVDVAVRIGGGIIGWKQWRDLFSAKESQ